MRVPGWTLLMASLMVMYCPWPCLETTTVCGVATSIGFSSSFACAELLLTSFPDLTSFGPLIVGFWAASGEEAAVMGSDLPNGLPDAGNVSKMARSWCRSRFAGADDCEC